MPLRAYLRLFSVHPTGGQAAERRRHCRCRRPQMRRGWRTPPAKSAGSKKSTATGLPRRGSSSASSHRRRFFRRGGAAPPRPARCWSLLEGARENVPVELGTQICPFRAGARATRRASDRSEYGDPRRGNSARRGGTAPWAIATMPRSGLRMAHGNAHPRSRALRHRTAAAVTVRSASGFCRTPVCAWQRAAAIRCGTAGKPDTNLDRVVAVLFDANPHLIIQTCMDESNGFQQ